MAPLCSQNTVGVCNQFTLLILYHIRWFRSCNKCNLVCLLWSKTRKHSSPNFGLCCFNSYNPRITFSEVFIFSLMFSQALVKFSLSLKLSKAANLFDILIWYCYLTASSLSFLRLHFSTSNFCAACLLTADLSLTFQPAGSDQYHSKPPWKTCECHLLSINIW